MQLAKIIKQARKSKGITQRHLAVLIGVQPYLVSHWETNRAHPREYFDKLEDILGIPLQQGKWLREKRKERGLTVSQLAERSGYSIGFIYNIENGNTPSPNPNTLQTLAESLGIDEPTLRYNTEFTREVNQGSTSHIGELYDVDIENVDEIAGISGVYIFWSAKRQPIYLGQSEDIGNRYKQHKDKFWFKTPIVSSMSYIEIQDNNLRKSVEKILLSVLRDILVINRNL